ncbi:hypothetical protein TSL6_15360 [Sulfurovum sp. TSL6]|nr:hypothetical protein [Sulfurovum sp. TSL6]GIU01030.1 hypothetical protein TSL6_15360 [Sulfurovum sp. TSL6]
MKIHGIRPEFQPEAMIEKARLVNEAYHLLSFSGFYLILFTTKS